VAIQILTHHHLDQQSSKMFGMKLNGTSLKARTTLCAAIKPHALTSGLQRDCALRHCQNARRHFRI